MFEQIVRSILNFFVHKVSKTSDVSKVTLDLKETSGTYVLGISSTVALLREGPVPVGPRSRKLLSLFLVALSLLIVLDVVGMLIPDASLGRTLVYLGEFPAILVNIIAARYIIRNISQRSQETPSIQA